jgi:hypothetical protein
LNHYSVGKGGEQVKGFRKKIMVAVVSALLAVSVPIAAFAAPANNQYCYQHQVYGNHQHYGNVHMGGYMGSHMGGHMSGHMGGHY